MYIGRPNTRLPNTTLYLVIIPRVVAAYGPGAVARGRRRGRDLDPGGVLAHGEGRVPSVALPSNRQRSEVHLLDVLGEPSRGAEVYAAGERAALRNLDSRSTGGERVGDGHHALLAILEYHSASSPAVSQVGLLSLEVEREVPVGLPAYTQLLQQLTCANRRVNVLHSGQTATTDQLIDCDAVEREREGRQSN